MGPFPVLAPAANPSLIAVQGAEPVGTVTTVDGAASATRADGTLVTLAPGAPIFAGDVLATGAGSALAVTFVDATVFALGAEARMVVDNLVYDPSAGGSASFDLVSGAFAFVAGSIADQGAMAVNTPVATIGIRGTSVAARLGGLVPLIVSLLPDPDGHLGTVVVANAAGRVTLDDAAETTQVLSAAGAPEPPEILAPEGLATLYGGALGLAGLGQVVLGDADTARDAADASNAIAVTFAQPVVFEAVETAVEATEATGATEQAITFVAAPGGSSFSLLGIQIEFLGIVTTGGLGRFATLRLENGELLFIPIEDENFVFGTAGDDVLTGTAGVDDMFGLDGDDVLFGAAGDDELFGGAGNDTLDGGTGFDLMLGGPGDDTYQLDDGLDVVLEEPGQGFDVVFTPANMIVLGAVELIVQQGGDDISVAAVAQEQSIAILGNSGNNLLIGGSAGDSLLGNGGTDILVGNAGGDVLAGGASPDVLVGGAGTDVLIGGAGGDFFSFADPEDVAFVARNGPAPLASLDVDLILDFDSGDDKVALTAVVAPGAREGGQVQGLTFSTIAGPFNGTNAGANVAHAAGKPAFVFSHADATLYFDANGDADGYTAVVSFDDAAPQASDIVVAAA